MRRPPKMMISGDFLLLADDADIGDYGSYCDSSMSEVFRISMCFLQKSAGGQA